MRRKRVFIKNYGCQMNGYDAGKMAVVLARAGWQSQDAPEGADLIILNSCHIRAKAAEKIYSEIGRLAKEPLLALAGCVAQAEGEAIFARAPRTDFILGPQMIHRVAELAEAAQARRKKKRGVKPAALDFSPAAKFTSAAPATKCSAFLTVQEGCDKFCSFCVVPYTRGAEFSRPAAQVLAEAKQQIARGAKELILLGQNVNSWRAAAPGGGQWDFARLLAGVAALPGLRRLRYTTSHPKDLTPALIAAHRDLAPLMPQLNLPLQSGSDKILAAMNRGHKIEDYLARIAELRAARPDIALSADFIVGFPGESEADFRQTLEAAKAAKFAHAYIFRYSPRPGTPAAKLKPLPQAETAERMTRLQRLIAEQALAFNRQFIGREVPVLLEQPGRRPGFARGRSPHGVRSEVAIKNWHPGDMVRTMIESAAPYGLTGRARAGQEGAIA